MPDPWFTAERGAPGHDEPCVSMLERSFLGGRMRYVLTLDSARHLRDALTQALGAAEFAHVPVPDASGPGVTVTRVVEASEVHAQGDRARFARCKQDLARTLGHRCDDGQADTFEWAALLDEVRGLLVDHAGGAREETREQAHFRACERAWETGRAEMAEARRLDDTARLEALRGLAAIEAYMAARWIDPPPSLTRGDQRKEKA